MLVTDLDARTPDVEEERILKILDEANEVLMDGPMMPVMLVEHEDAPDGYALAVLQLPDSLPADMDGVQLMKLLADSIWESVMSGKTQENPLSPRVQAVGACYGARILIQGESDKVDELINRAMAGSSVATVTARDGGEPIQQTVLFHLDGKAYLSTKSRNGGEVPENIGRRVFYVGDDSYPTGELENALMKIRDAIQMERR